MFGFINHGPPPEHLRFNETLNPTRTKLISALLRNRLSIDGSFTTFRIGYHKGKALTPQQPPLAKPAGNQIDIFLGDSKHSPTTKGKATVLRCTLTLWRYADHFDFQNCLDGNTAQAVEYWLNQYYTKFNPPVSPIDPTTKISIITI